MKKQWFEPNYTMNHFTCIMIVAMVATGKKHHHPKKYIFPGAFHGPGKPQGSKVKLPIFGFEFPMGKTYHKPK
jgi:hypothetical protein